MKKKKFVEINEIAEQLKPGDLLVFGYTHSGYNQLFEKLAERLPKNITFFMPFWRFRKEDLPRLDPLFEKLEKLEGKIITPLPIPEFSKFIQEKKMDVIYLTWSQLPNFLIQEKKTRRIWLFSEITPPKNGWCNTSFSVFYPSNLYEDFITVGIINKSLPETFGDSQISSDLFDYFLELPEPKLPLYTEMKSSPVAKKIAEYVSELIDNNSTIQLGQGSLITPIIDKLTEKENLKIHTGFFHEALKKLIDKNVIKEKCKTHIVVPTSLEFYNWLNRNPIIELKAIDYLYNYSVIATIPSFIAINTAVYVDLQGHVAATYGSHIIAGVGGLPDFARGAKLSKGGKSIIVIEATRKEDPLIKPKIISGDIVALSCYDVDYIVTEYGIAKLSGKSRREIVQSLIDISSPDHRKMLFEEAKSLNLL